MAAGSAYNKGGLPMEWKDYLKQIDAAYSLGPEGGLERLRSLDAACRDEYGPDSREYASMRNELGAFYKGLGRFDEAEACFRNAMELFEAHGGRGDAACATALNNLAGTHRLTRRFDEAEAEFSECIRLYAATVGENHVLYAAALNNLSLVYLDQEKPEQAAGLQERAAKILKGLPECRDELCTSLSNLGALYQRMGRLDAAEALLTEALRMLREELGTDTPHYHETLNTLGVVCYLAGRYAEAEEHFAAAAAAAEAMYGPAHYEAKTAREHAALARKQREAAT